MLFWLMACRSEAECVDGFTAGADGLCYEVTAAGDDTGGEDTDEPPTVEDVIDALPACEPEGGDGRLELVGGCADGACVGMTYVEMSEAIGEEALYCDTQYLEFGGYTSSSVSCDWSNGAGANFADDDRDGAADALSTAYALYLSVGFDGTTEDGLGMGANLRCLVDSLGYPDETSFVIIDKDWFVRSASWNGWGVSLSDYYDAFGDYAPDGQVDSMSVYGSVKEF